MKSKILLTRIEDGERTAVWIDLSDRSGQAFDAKTWAMFQALAQMIASYEDGFPTIVVSDTGRRSTIAIREDV